MKSIFKLGDKKQFTKVIGLSDLAEFESGEVHKVYGTFALGRDAEWSSRLFVLEMKEEDEEGIGTFLNITPALNKKNINFSLKKNGELMQKGLIGDMIFSFDSIIEHISNYFSLNNGDLIFTGTPAGVGECVVGDELDCYIENEKLLSVQIK